MNKCEKANLSCQGCNKIDNCVLFKAYMQGRNDEHEQNEINKKKKEGNKDGLLQKYV